MELSLVGSVIVCSIQHIFTGFIEPEFYTQVRRSYKNWPGRCRPNRRTNRSQIAMQAKFQGTAIGDAIGLLFMAFVGFVVSAIAAAIKKHTEEDQLLNSS